jgi:hypothetical protein
MFVMEFYLCGEALLLHGVNLQGARMDWFVIQKWLIDKLLSAMVPSAL